MVLDLRLRHSLSSVLVSMDVRKSRLTDRHDDGREQINHLSWPEARGQPGGVTFCRREDFLVRSLNYYLTCSELLCLFMTSKRLCRWIQASFTLLYWKPLHHPQRNLRVDLVPQQKLLSWHQSPYKQDCIGAELLVADIRGLEEKTSVLLQTLAP